MTPWFSRKSHVSRGLLSKRVKSVLTSYFLAPRDPSSHVSSAGPRQCASSAPTILRPIPPPRLKHAYLHRPAPLRSGSRVREIGTQLAAPSLLTRRARPASGTRRDLESAHARFPGAGEVAAGQQSIVSSQAVASLRVWPISAELIIASGPPSSLRPGEGRTVAKT